MWKLMWENLVFLVLFDTCDVVYHWSISLLQSIVLDNLLGINQDKTNFKPVYPVWGGCRGGGEGVGLQLRLVCSITNYVSFQGLRFPLSS